MRKYAWLILIVLLGLAAFLPNRIHAKLTALDPKAMIAESDQIFRGNIIELQSSEESQTAKVSMDRIYKGIEKDKVLTVSVQKDPEAGWLHKLPPQGTEVVLLMHKSKLTGDGNAVAIVQDQKVVSFADGKQFGSSTIESYLNEYNQYMDSFETKSKINKWFNAWNLSAMSVGVLIIFFWRGKSKK